MDGKTVPKGNVGNKGESLRIGIVGRPARQSKEHNRPKL